MISAFKMGGDVNYFNVSLTVPGKSHETVHEEKEKGEPTRRVEPGSLRLPAERFTARPSRFTNSADNSIALSTCSPPPPPPSLSLSPSPRVPPPGMSVLVVASTKTSRR